MTNQEIADNLLWSVWRGIPDAYKRKYARNIWEQFENNIRNAAYTSSLSRFFTDLCSRLMVSIGAGDSEGVAHALTGGEDRAVLRALRDEATTLTLLVRLKNEERKAEFRDREKPAESKQEAMTDNADLFL